MSHDTRRVTGRFHVARRGRSAYRHVCVDSRACVRVCRCQLVVAARGLCGKAALTVSSRDFAEAPSCNRFLRRFKSHITRSLR